MDKDIISGLIQNVTLLTTLIIIYEISYTVSLKRINLVPFLNGVLIGLIGLAVMALSFSIDAGIYLDTRSILISITALIFGVVSSVVAAIIMIAYRIALGGDGLWTGVYVIITSACIGILWRFFVLPRYKKFKLVNMYLFGVVVSSFMLIDFLVMPAEFSRDILKEIFVPVMFIFPFTTVLISIILLNLEEQKESHMKLVEAEGRYRSIFNNNHGVMLLIDPESGNIIDANPAAANFYGWSIKELQTMNISQINSLSSLELKDEMAKSAAGNKNHFLFLHRRAAGEPVDVEVYGGPIELDGRTLIYSIVHDISERIASEKALSESEKRFRLLVESAPEVIFIETGGKFSYINKFAVSILGAESADQLINTPVLDRFHSDYHKTITERMEILRDKKEAVPTLEEVLLKLDGTPVNVEVKAVPIHYNLVNGALVFARDITDRKILERKKNEIEAQLRQQQKLEAIGTLAGGVAHEINNPINGIMNYAQLILDGSGNQNTKQAEFAKEIISETERVATIVRNLLQFSRQEKQSHSYASIYDIINQSVSLINTVVKRDQITLVVDLDEGLPDIKCRSQQIQQVIMNLLTNARDALNEKFEGYNEDKLIFVTCSYYTSDNRRWIKMIVEDHGNGIPVEVRDKIFEPFFSTKPKEIGTGLGLSISFGIVSDHHGKIDFETMEGRYTKFILDLPVDNGWKL